MRRLAQLLTGVVAVAGISLSPSGPAGAATAPIAGVATGSYDVTPFTGPDCVFTSTPFTIGPFSLVGTAAFGVADLQVGVLSGSGRCAGRGGIPSLSPTVSVYTGGTTGSAPVTGSDATGQAVHGSCSGGSPTSFSLRQAQTPVSPDLPDVTLVCSLVDGQAAPVAVTFYIQGLAVPGGLSSSFAGPYTGS